MRLQQNHEGSKCLPAWREIAPSRAELFSPPPHQVLGLQRKLLLEGGRKRVATCLSKDCLIKSRIVATSSVL